MSSPSTALLTPLGVVVQAFVQLSFGLLLPLSIRHILDTPVPQLAVASPQGPLSSVVLETVFELSIAALATVFTVLMFVWPLVRLVASANA